MKKVDTVGNSDSLTRRELIAASAAAALVGMPWVARAQARDKVTFTLSWVPQASNAYAYIAKSKGFWSKRGIDVDIVRGFGSGADRSGGRRG